MPALVGLLDRSQSKVSSSSFSHLTEVLSQRYGDTLRTCISNSTVIPSHWCTIYPSRNNVKQIKRKDDCLCLTHQTIPQNNDSIQTLSNRIGEEFNSSLLHNLGEPLTTCIIVCDRQDRQIVARSHDGQIPLYVSSNPQQTIFATQKKALWALGISNINVVAPGDILTFYSSNYTRVESSFHAGVVPEIRSSVGTMLDNLETHLLNSISKLSGVDRVAVLFSGGMDSSLLASLSSRYVNEVVLVSAFSKGAKDQTVTRNHANKLDIEMIPVMLNSDAIWSILPEIIYAIEDTNPMDVEIAIPFFLSSKAAASLGHNLLISGQGPDEIFGGYARHVRILRDQGEDVLHRHLIRDLSITHEANIARDMKAIDSWGCEAFFPYLAPSFVQYGISISAKHKITLGKEATRKVIFRKLGLRLGLPEVIAEKGKSATQYSSGSSKTLLDAVSSNVGKLQNATNREKRKALPEVLNQIGQTLGIPLQVQEYIASDSEMEHAYKYAENRDLAALD